MKFFLSFFILLFTGFINLSGAASLQADTDSTELGSFADFIGQSQDQIHIDFGWPNTPQLTLAEFEIEESISSLAKEKQVPCFPFSGIQNAVIQHFYIYKYKYLDSDAIPSVRTSVKSYLLFQVFRL